MELITRTNALVQNLGSFWGAILPVVGTVPLVLLGLSFALAMLELLQVLALQIKTALTTRKQPPATLLELTFPSDTSKSAFATEQLYILLHSRATRQSIRSRLLRTKKTYSLEIVSTKDEGIRYVMAVPKGEEDVVQHNLQSFLPGLKIKAVGDYVLQRDALSTAHDVVELKLSADFALSLQDHKLLAEHDTMAYLTGHMTKLAPGEFVGFQLVATPVKSATHPHIARRISALQRHIASGRPITPMLRSRNIALPLHVLPVLLKVIFGPIAWVMRAIPELPAFLFDDHYHANKQAANTSRVALDPYEVELGAAVKDKLNQHLYEATIRILVVAGSESKVRSRIEALTSSMRSFSSPQQSITTRHNVPFLSSPASRLAQYCGRLLTPDFIDQNMVLSGSELADLYHFPNTDLTKTEGLVKSRSRELPAPLSLKSTHAKFDVVIGVNNYGGEESPIGLTLEQRQKHTYVIGKTGMGKTTLLTSSIYQDMVNGKGLAVLDPHGDMFRELLQIVPEHRRNDVVVFDPSERDFPLGLNLLDPGIDFASVDDKHEWITSTVLSVFAKLADEVFWGPRMEHILRYTTLTALALPNPTIYTLQRLLTDKPYQIASAKTLKDPVLKQFWQKELALLGDMQLSAVTAPLTHRLGHFIATKMSRHILLQEHSTIRIADIMNEGKILLVNLSKGDLGEDQSSFFGTILTSLIWMAAYQRTKIPEPKRRDFFVYVDEFQNFATPRFSEITSEGRKFHVSLIASHQNIAQIEDSNLLKIVAGNASTIICLKASPSDEQFILPFMQSEVSKGDIVSLAPYQFFMKTSGEVSEDAFTGGTVPIEASRSEATAETVVAASRAQYGTPRDEVEAYVRKLFRPIKPDGAATTSADSPGATPLSTQPTLGKKVGL